MSKLYLTADAIGTPTGGGKVTANEVLALQPTTTWAFPNAPRPWGADDAAFEHLTADPARTFDLAHCYSGTFTKTIELLKARGAKVTCTAAAHDIAVSREEHEKRGIPFDYPHLTDPELWARYVGGYLLADLVICPSTYSQQIMRGYGCKNVVVIPHGVDLPAQIVPPPKRFAVAALGQLAGPDKGAIYLLQAWERLNYPDALLTIAGYGTEDLLPLVRQLGGSIYLRGKVDDVSEVYNACSLFVQPSASEGFGIEVLEAQAHGRPVVCSAGAGASTLASYVVTARDSQALAAAIDKWREWHVQSYHSTRAREMAEAHAWPWIHNQYQRAWADL